MTLAKFEIRPSLVVNSTLDRGFEFLPILDENGVIPMPGSIPVPNPGTYKK